MEETNKLINRLRAIQKQIAEQMDKIETVLQNNREHLKDAGQTLHQHMFELRELIQLLIYQTEMIGRSKGSQ
ncbi:MAG TPA: hypothetical protein VNO70_23785 [Blastocatellia bacterium]|nr:hypothetical protein [Blastocatellia bacterium]